jgi:ATP-binding cassette subfamily A (ABC1) protein 3
MEEAEALATKVAIMGTRMLATGTLSTLQEQHGGLYSVRAIRTPETISSDVEGKVRECFKGTVLNYQDKLRQIRFNLPQESSSLGKILKTMERLRGNDVQEDHQGGLGAGGGSSVITGLGVIGDYTVNRPTLEEVFMNVARESNVTGV